jgi:hypothetical protein
MTLLDTEYVHTYFVTSINTLSTGLVLYQYQLLFV